MAIRGLTNEQHRHVLENLVNLASSVSFVKLHAAGPEYTSLMVCFLMHNLAAADSVLRLHDSFGDDPFPTTVGYTLVRTMFEIDVTAHYIARDPSARARDYVDYGAILKKREIDAWGKHRTSDKEGWREAMETAWKYEWAKRQDKIKSDYDSVRSKFERETKKGKLVPFSNWSGKSIHEMAIEVDHEEAYDVFYADLSSFAHADVRLADRFLRLSPNGMSWSKQARWPDIGGVFRYADIFLDCFLRLFGQEFSSWPKDRVKACWEVTSGSTDEQQE